MRERCSCIVGLFSYVAPSSWCDACNSRILMHSPTDNEAISADVDTDSLYGQDIGQIDTYASLGRSSCLAGPNMLKLELFWNHGWFPGMPSTEVVRGLYGNCMGY